jgi:hypothetical protein
LVDLQVVAWAPLLVVSGLEVLRPLLQVALALQQQQQHLAAASARQVCSLCLMQ